MPTAATQILSLSQAKAALRVDGDAGDSDLTASIEAAVAYCERLAGKPLLDVDRTFFVDRPALSTDPLVVPVIYVLPGVEVPEEGEPEQPRGVKEIAYWTVANGALRAPPDGSVAVSNLGRVEVVKRDCTAIWPDADGWPSVLTDSQFKVTVTQGWPAADGDAEAEGYDIAADIPGIAGIRRAVALMTGVYYDGIVEDTHRKAVAGLLGPFRDARFLI